MMDFWKMDLDGVSTRLGGGEAVDSHAETHNKSGGYQICSNNRTSISS